MYAHLCSNWRCENILAKWSSSFHRFGLKEAVCEKQTISFLSGLRMKP